MATFRFMRACHPYLVGGGSIVNVGSGVALRPSTAGFGCYAAVKEAIRSLTRAAACEWGPAGIRANVIMPLSMSPAMEGFFAALPEVAEEMLGQIPLGRMGDSQQDIGQGRGILVQRRGRLHHRHYVAGRRRAGLCAVNQVRPCQGKDISVRGLPAVVGAEEGRNGQG